MIEIIIPALANGDKMAFELDTNSKKIIATIQRNGDAEKYEYVVWDNPLIF